MDSWSVNLSDCSKNVIFANYALLMHHFKWKTTMPPNWQDGDNVLDRLTQAGIVMT
jgi:hypothetical protein